MNISMTELLLTSFRAVLLGVAVGALYDVFRIIRIVFGTGTSSGEPSRFSRIYSKGVRDLFSRHRGKIFDISFTAVTDVAFCICAAVMFILFLYAFNHGVFRWFILLSLLIGFRLYYLSFGRAVIKLSKTMSDILKLIVNVSLYIIYFPLTQVLSLIVRKVFAPIFGNIKKCIDKRRRRRYTLYSIDRLERFVNIEGI